MTGFGSGEAAQNGCKVTVEISSVNRRQAEIAINLPDHLETLEGRIREAINRELFRGRVHVRINLDSAEGRAGKVRVNRELAAAYAREFSLLAQELSLGGTPTLDTILRAPGVLETEIEREDAETVWPLISAALEDALAQLVKMREQEGAHLARDLHHRLGILRQATSAIRLRAPGVAEQYRRQLHDRIASAGLTLTAEDQDRILKEVALFADRSDISEELTRLESHFTQFEECLQGKEPAGRTLDFLAQEMHREANTVGSKANDASIAREVVRLKTEMERIREQAQNLE